MRQRLQSLIDIGLFDDTPPEQIKLVRLSNISILLVTGSFWGNSLLFLFMGERMLPLLGAIGGLLQLGFLYLNQRQLYQRAWLGLLLVNLGLIFTFSTLLSRDAAVFWYYSLAILTTYIFFFRGQYRTCRRVSLGAIAIAVLLDLGFSVHPFGQHHLDAEELFFARWGIPAFCFFVMVAYIYYFMRETQKYEGELARKSLHLEERNAQLMKVNQELDKFVYHASHDLRAPVASTLGLIMIARQSQDLAEIMGYMDMQERSLTKLDNLIKDILNYSRNKTNELVKETVNFQNLVEEVFEQHRYIPAPTQPSLELIVDQEGTFVSDPGRLNVILSNLISNAIRYHNPEALDPSVRVTVRSTPTDAIVEVKDNGLGIRADQIDRIFDMFFRGTNKSNGTGLGLYIVKETMETLGGEVTVDSVLGEGTSFQISIPNYLSTAVVPG